MLNVLLPPNSSFIAQRRRRLFFLFTSTFHVKRSMFNLSFEALAKKDVLPRRNQA
jgi:hypothetical protein